LHKLFRSTLDDIWYNKIIIVIGINRGVGLIFSVEFDSQSFSNTRENEVKRIRIVK